MKAILTAGIVLAIVVSLVGCGGNMSQSGEATTTTMEELSSNVLMNKQVKTYSVYNGSGTEVIGSRAKITATKDELTNCTSEEFDEFVMSCVDGQSYNWFTIELDDGTGIVFSGCGTSLFDYGEIGNDGMLSTTLGFIKRNSDHEYVYEAR